MNERKTITEPTGYDYAPTEQIPVQGDPPGDREEHEPIENEHVMTDRASGVTDSAGFAEPVPAAEPVPSAPPVPETTGFVEPLPAAYPAPPPPGPGPDGFTEPAAAPTEPVPVAAGQPGDAELFAGDAVHRFRERWREVQAGFVDDPGEAVRGANELVDEI